MGLKRKISITLVLLFLGVAAALIVTQRTAKASHDLAEHLIREDVVKIKTMQSALTSLMRMDTAALRYFNTKDPGWMAVLRTEKQSFIYALEQLRKVSTDRQELDTLYIVQKTFNRYAKKVDSLTAKKDSATLTQKDLTAWSAFDGEIDRLYQQAGQYVAYNQGQMSAAEEQGADLIARNRRTAYTALALTGLACFLALFFFSYSVIKPAGVLVDAVQRFGREKKFEEVPIYSRDELGDLARAFNKLGLQLEQERNRLKDQAVKDELTGVYNLRYFRQKIAEEFSRVGRYGYDLSMLMLDVDHFKHYNDTNGHPMGDVILKDIARIIRESVRETDIVCRYGGEEFAILLLATGLEKAEKIAQKIRLNVENHAFPKGESQPDGSITVSIGVAACHNGLPAVSQGLVNLADKALYAAKEQGRNRVVVAEPADEEEDIPLPSRRRKTTST